MGMGELIGMRWILWGERKELPKDVAAAVETLIRRLLGAGK